MKFQFFHGTSSIFLNSILENGLGGINPTYDHGYLETLKRLFEIAERHLIEQQEFRIIYDTTKAMAMQAKLKVQINGRDELFNFRHDGIYVALSLERAVCYASTNKYGSEILTTSIKLMDMLTNNQIDYSNIGYSIDDFENLKLSSPKPIILKILELDENDLDKEDGKTAKEALDFLRSVLPSLSEKEKFEFFQYCNFKILKPIPAEQLIAYELDFEGRFGNEGFEYTMTKL
ncbi:hypothetical protein [Fulvivirga ligni]|uniref:hypothetical protein n=1 Tax=Fulvivirga ligni TaxID=2904246 RepID=UPI001F201347|nr:hypothetical protein [Fulvivirga ligni]UII20568.1 hypothetical protein LVD16_22260 [Fulvivirga ligni]